MSRHTRPPQHSVTAAVIAEMQLYGYRPHDEPDPRPLPDAQVAQTALIDIFDAVVSTFADTRLEPDVEELLWSVVNLFHRAGQRAQRRLDDNEDLQRRGQDEPTTAPEVRSVNPGTRTPDRRRHQPDREAQHLRRLHGPRRRTLRAAQARPGNPSRAPRSITRP